ncbi:MAG: winged helix-turn-helix domain-containing protein [Pseudomonadota bacterium]
MSDGFDIDRLDEVIHGRLRLGIMAFLAGAGAADFNTLKTRLQATDGNLSAHLRKLEDAGYVAAEKAFVNRKPLTTLSITPAGRRAFAAYLEAIGRLVEEGRGEA